MQSITSLSLARNISDNAVTVRKIWATNLFYDLDCLIEEHLMAFKQGEGRIFQRWKLKERHSI